MGFDSGQFHFANILWLWGLCVIPVVLLLYALFYKGSGQTEQLKRFADAHLLPHLVKNTGSAKKSAKGGLLRWSLLWILAMIAMAGPRFGYTDVHTFQPERDLVIVLDLAQSMNAQDVKPSRIVRAQQEIDDILNLQKGVTVGLVAFARVPHMVVPLTDDMKMIKNLVPALDTSLITVQGDRLKPALNMAAKMLDGAPRGNDKSILVISDGNFDESDFSALVRAGGGARIYTMGIGTRQGAPVPEGNGGFVTGANGNMLISRLQVGKLKTLARLGGGIYVHADYTHDDTDAILGRVEGVSAGAVHYTPKTIRIWNGRFYVLVLLIALVLLPLFKRGAAFPAVALSLLLLHPASAQAAEYKNLFFNQAQQGKIAFEAQDYKAAMKKFKSPYRKGVAAYRAKEFSRAAELFGAVKNPKLHLAAQYNAANAKLMDGKIKDAIAGYKAVLKESPHDRRARHNLAIAEKLLKLKKQQQKKDKKQGKQGKKSERQNSTQDKNGNKNSGHKNNGKQNSGTQKDKSQTQKHQREKTRATKTRKDKATPENGKKAGAEKTGKKKAQKRKASGLRRANAPRPLTQKDIDANQWLNHIQSDPGSFLRNQFRIEERKARAEEEENQ